VGLIAITSPETEPDAAVRAAAATALGSIGDASAVDALEAAADGDPDGLVRDAARIALRRL
jgi:HEAT repeat protein